jgi:hypothetical protein
MLVASPGASLPTARRGASSWIGAWAPWQLAHVVMSRFSWGVNPRPHPRNGDRQQGVTASRSWCELTAGAQLATLDAWAHACICHRSPTLNGPHRRSGETISAVEYKQGADRHANTVRPGPFENRHPQRDPNAAPNRKGHSRLHRSACRNFQTETPCTTRPKAMINVAVCVGVRMCSQTAVAAARRARTHKSRAPA